MLSKSKTNSSISCAKQTFISRIICLSYDAFIFFHSEMNKQLLSGCSPLYQNKLQEQRVQDVVNRDKIKFEPYGHLVGQAFSQFNGNSKIKSHTAKLKMMKHQW